MFAIRLIYDTYTPAVEAQITRDLIAMKNAQPKETLAVICEMNDCEKIANVLDIALYAQGTARLNIIYKVGEQWPEHPDARDEIIIERDLYVSEEIISVDPNPSIGYYMPPQGRIIRDQVDLSRQGPKGGSIDPAILLTWGGASFDYGTGIF